MCPILKRSEMPTFQIIVKHRPTVLGSPRCATASGVEMKIRSGQGFLSSRNVVFGFTSLFIQPISAPYSILIQTWNLSKPLIILYKPHCKGSSIFVRLLTKQLTGTQRSSTRRRTTLHLALHSVVHVAVMMELRKLNRVPNVPEFLSLRLPPSLRPNRHLGPTKRSKSSVLTRNEHCMSRTCSAGFWGCCAPTGSCKIQIQPIK